MNMNFFVWKIFFINIKKRVKYLRLRLERENYGKEKKYSQELT